MHFNRKKRSPLAKISPRRGKEKKSKKITPESLEVVRQAIKQKPQKRSSKIRISTNALNVSKCKDIRCLL